MLVQRSKEQINFESRTYFMTAFKILLWNFLLTAGPRIIKKCLICCQYVYPWIFIGGAWTYMIAREIRTASMTAMTVKMLNQYPTSLLERPRPSPHHVSQTATEIC